MPISITPHKGQIPFVDFDDDYFYIPVALMSRRDILQETKICFSMALTEYLPSGLEYAQKHLEQITIDDVVRKYKQPVILAKKIRDEIINLAPDLSNILMNIH